MFGGDPGTDQVPEYYVPQPMWYMGITGARYCDVPVLIGGNDFRLIAAVHFNTKVVFVLRFMTHAEYDKNTWKDDL